VRGLNVLAATISTPLAAPVIAATRLRSGNAASARGAASFAAASAATARAAGCTGTLVVRADSAFYSAAFTGAVRRAGAFFSVTVRMDPKVRAAIAAIPETAWTTICYPRAIWDGPRANTPHGRISTPSVSAGNTPFHSLRNPNAAAPFAERISAPHSDRPSGMSSPPVSSALTGWPSRPDPIEHPWSR
jgi:hypothetical protein